VYVSGSLPQGRGEGGALVALARNSVTGGLSELPGQGGCANGSGSEGCAAVRCLGTEMTLALSHDRSHLYAGSTDSLDPESTGSGMLGTFWTSRTGAASFIRCAQRDEAISSLVARPTDTSVFVSTFSADRGTGVSSATIDLYRPASGGQLLPDRSLVCAGHQPCPIPFGPSSSRMAITPDGMTVYYSSSFDGIATLRAGPRSLAPLAGHWGCLFPNTLVYLFPRYCAHAGQVIGPDMVVSPDSRNLYVGTVGSGMPYNGGIETFTIQP